MEIEKLTERIIGCAYTVSNRLGCGFLETVYENALVQEIRKTGLGIEQQYRMKVLYDGVVVGDYTADLLVERRLLVELKAVSGLDGIHFAQCVNYLKATGLPTCLLINFGRPKVQVRRLNNRFLKGMQIPST